MPAPRHFTRVNTLELKCRIEGKLGHARSAKYFDLLTRYLSHKVNKCEFDKLCIGIIGRENVHLHNYFLRSIVKNACLSKTLPPKDTKMEGSFSVEVANGYQRSCLQSISKDFARKGRTPNNIRDGKFKDRPSPLGPLGKSYSVTCDDTVPKIQEQQSATELFSMGSRPPGSVEDGEEVDQAAGSPSIYCRSPITAPFGVSTNGKGTRKLKALRNSLATSYYSESCQSSGELPDSSSLQKRLEKKLEKEGLSISVDCANLLNNAVDIYMKRLLKPCLEIAGLRHTNQSHGSSRSGLNGLGPVRHIQKSKRSNSVSMLDFQVAMQLNPQILGEDWPTQLERVCLRASED